ncbi:long-chain-fatty-acid--CoA ligase FadD17 [Mycobacterium sp.]|uniref:long-chain-fatty-acid--CoA ligase FadD17 n=1 Tax=Mycobacterium sp. TaxID=1785 RepID=UPI003A87792A
MADPTVTELLAPLAGITDRGVLFEDSFTSWRDHLRHGAAVAGALRSRLDPTRPPHVGVLLQNTPFFSAILVAAAMSGIVPVGLNPVRRGAALARDIAHADCQLVLTDSKSAEPLSDIEHLNVDSPVWELEVAGYGDTDPVFRRCSPEDLFMLIFTSGTSGEPKAVKCSHGKVAVAGTRMAERFALGPDDVCYVSMPLFHSNAVMVGWAVAVACRGSIALRRKFSASGFLPDVRRYGASYANYVGKPLSYVLATPERPDDADNPLRAVYGNEGVPADLERFAGRFGCVVQDGFGSTEGGVAIARTPDTPRTALGPLPVGVTILSPETGEPCPPGVVGELVNTAGPGRFEGYYNDAGAEDERMAGGVYHTGDLAYRDKAGYAYFAGRLGDWMRVDGENLGTAPIERVLLRHRDVAAAAVYPVPDPVVGDRVMAALVMASGVRFDADEFRAFLAGQADLGPKQWPSYVRVSAQLPRTVTFKVLKRQLSADGLDCGDPVFEIRR